ncbi:FxSxx-COOH system tetratricopeptide repeat protein [Paractinoplanes toevensis]|uniref:ATP/GTP-binding protein n=1 Tax=Paractinoplanes toevensis TaxID=571911 RepID=A0A919W547_9ACTN|nr:FxSxx-COOH system tetratricopeptide repeat protein [Actinoplanes toevensis]GIM94984.1 hypothetical protein Ato02nite_067770 [Actinoplanes toevensis]
MLEDSGGKVVTFYSYKGGTGRTMALANVAWILAANGKRVLVADWDLDSPGLHRFFRPFIDPGALASSGGVVELVRRYEQATMQNVERPGDWHRDFARVSRHAFSIDWPHFPAGGVIDFLAAGNQDQNYARSIYERDWDEFYERYGGGQLFDALRDDMKAHYDYALIDSRTGWSDVAGICTVHMPDVLIDCFTFSEQGIDGAATVAANVTRLTGRRPIRILPVPMRVDLAEKKRADAGRLVARQRFTSLPAGMNPSERDAYWATVEVPYQPFYAYEETLATFGDRPGSRTSMLAAYETLTDYLTGGEVTGLPLMDESLRERTAARFVRAAVLPETTVALRHAPDDRLWAEWIARVLETAGVTVNLVTSGLDADSGAIPDGRLLTVISPANAEREEARVPRERTDPRAPLVVYVADVRPLRGQSDADSAFLVGQPEEIAITRLLKLVGHPVDNFDRGRVGLRYPGRATLLFNAPIRNVQFTGREDDLIELRSRLETTSSPVVLSGASPVALQGMGGIGKTQVAMEYAHRFRNAYDFVWWINSDPVTFIDTQLSELGRELGLPGGGSIVEQARAVLSALARGESLRRWLVILDNAEDVETVTRFLPRGPGGHVIITSRDAGWAERAESIQVDVFDRRESIAHLRRRVPAMRPDDAGRLADALGDLPIAVAAAGAWLADTGKPVAEYLGHLDEYGPSDLQPIWDLSLQRLKERSAAAYRLLQLCSVLAPEVALDLVYSDRMAELLRPLDPMVTETMYRGALVQQINRLALLKVDVSGGQIRVHRIVQHVVRQQMTSQQRDEARREVHLVLAAARPSGEVDDPGNWRRFQMIWPHLEVARVHQSLEEPVRRLIIDRLRYIWFAGGFNDGRRVGEDYVRRWEQLRETVTDPEARSVLSRQLLQLRFNLANIVRDQAEFETSREMDEAILTEQRRLLGDHHPHTLITAGGLGGDLRALGRYAEARKLDEETTAAWVEYFGEDHQRSLLALNNLAASLRFVGDFRAARDRSRQVFTRAGMILGPQHSVTLLAGGSLGRDLREAGEYEESVTLLRDILGRCRQAYGEEAPRTLNALTNLAVSERSAGRAQDAAQHLETAYETLNQVLGPFQPETLTCRLSRAVNLLAVGEAASAEAELLQMQRRYTERFGEEHPYTVSCLNNRAAVARARGDLTSARELALRAADSFEIVLGPEHPYTLAARMNQAIFMAEWGAVPQAHELLLPISARADQVIGPEHPDAVRCAANLVLMRRDLHGASPDEENEVLQRLIRALGVGHPAAEAMRERRYLHRTLDPHPY